MIRQRTKDNRVNIMKKDVSIENWILGGTVFILIFTIGCFVWFQYKMSITEQYEGNYKVETQHIDESSQTYKLTPIVQYSNSTRIVIILSISKLIFTKLYVSQVPTKYMLFL